jgi:hypothetical protein
MTPEQQAIYDKLPTHILLTPGVDKWRKGDEMFYDDWYPIEIETDGEWYGKKIGKLITARRPIPAPIREAQAWWTLYNRLATVVPDSRDGVIYAFVISTPKRYFLEVIKSRSLRGIRKFASEEAAKNAIPVLGGEDKISEMFSVGPGVFEQWLQDEI